MPLNEHELELKRQLEQRRDEKEKTDGYAYGGPEDFVLQHGVWYRPLGRPPFQGAPKSCFGNALFAAGMYQVPYIEGFALSGPVVIQGTVLWSLSEVKAVHHAWNLDQEGELADTTWMNTGLAYLGVQFSAGRADNSTWFDDASVLFNPHGSKLYREQWSGENFHRVWRQSKPMKQILRARERYR